MLMIFPALSSVLHLRTKSFRDPHGEKGERSVFIQMNQGLWENIGSRAFACNVGCTFMKDPNCDDTTWHDMTWNSEQSYNPEKYLICIYLLEKGLQHVYMIPGLPNTQNLQIFYKMVNWRMRFFEGLSYPLQTRAQISTRREDSRGSSLAISLNVRLISSVGDFCCDAFTYSRIICIVIISAIAYGTDFGASDLRYPRLFSSPSSPFLSFWASLLC